MLPCSRLMVACTVKKQLLSPCFHCYLISTFEIFPFPTIFPLCQQQHLQFRVASKHHVNARESLVQSQQ